MNIPQKLKEGDEIRIIAPARSGSIISDEIENIAQERLEEMGLKVSFSKNYNEEDGFLSSSIESRVDDLHEAFIDPNVKGVLTVIGGFNSNQMLRYIDWNIIKNNPKVLCGYSDITALSNAIYTKTGLVTYSGMHFSTFGQKKLQKYNIEYFKKCLFSDSVFTVVPSEKWSDDEWYKNQDNRNFLENQGWWVINEGEAQGQVFGANLATFRLLYGTEYMTPIKDSILFIEDDNYTTNDVAEFDRNLQSLIHQKDFETVKALVIGRFQIGSEMSREEMEKIIKSKKELSGIPVVANVDFGHTDPIFTFPIGGEVKVFAGSESRLEVIKH